MWKHMVQPEATDDVIRRMRLASWIRLQTRTQNILCLLFFHDNNGYANAPLCYVIRTLLVFHVSGLVGKQLYDAGVLLHVI
jgi:hypothetical protein